MTILRSVRAILLLAALAALGSAQSITLTLSPNPATPLDAIFVTAQFTVPVGSAVGADGQTVTFRDNGVAVGTPVVTANGGVAFTSIGPFTVGTHPITATITLNSTTTVTSNTVNLVVRPNLTSSLNPSTYCDPVTFTIVPPGFFETSSVLLVDGLNTLATIQLANGTGSFTTSTLTPGTHNIGAAVFTPSSTFATLVQTVNRLTPPITLATAPNPSALGQLVTMTATIGGCNTTGTITFFDGQTALGTAQIANGAAVFLTSTLAPGTHPITARYNGDNNNNTSVSNTVNQVVTSAPGITFTSAPNPSTACQSVTLTATLTPPDIPPPPAGSLQRRIPGPPVTGTVTFTDGNTTLGTVPIVGGVATLQTTLLAGSHRLNAVYNPDANYTSTSASLTQVVNPAASTVTLTSAPNPSLFGQQVTMTATVTGCGTPTGNVTFLDGTGNLSTVNLANGSASFSTSALSTGTHPLSARYNADTNNAAATSNTVNQVVGKIATTTTLTLTPNPANSGQPVVLTATVAPSGTSTSLIPTGTVQFFNGSTQVGSASVNTAGVATLSVTTLPNGSNTITATYGGDNNFQTSSSSAVPVRVLNPANLTVTAAPNPAAFGQTITLTARLSATGAIGIVTFKDGNATVGAAGLANGVATATVSTLSVGTHTITASFAGDNNTSSGTATVDVTVNRANTTTTLAPNVTSVPPGGAITLTARVSPGNPTGSVTFLEGTRTIGTATVTDATASIQTSFSTLGQHVITASYGGDANNSPSTSSAVSIAVGLPATTTSLGASPATPVFGQPVVLTATVTPTGATGAVTFTEGAATIGTANLSGGTASVTAPALAVGSHSFTATYAGDANNSGSTGNVTVTVSRAPATVTVSATPSPATAGQSVTIAAAVAPAGATGTVTFTDGGTTLGTATLANGAASLSTAALTEGPHTLTATYAGDANFLGASGSASLTVNPAGPPPLTISGPATIPNGVIGQAYPAQTITATGGTPPYNWTIQAAGTTTSDFTIANSGNNGSLTGTPKTAGTFTVTVQVRDSATTPATATRTYNVTIAFPALPPINVSSTQVTLGQSYPIPLRGTLTLTFAPNAANLPANFVNKQLLFQNGTNTVQVDIPANSTAPVAIPPFQQGSVAGTITVTLTGVVHAQTGQAVTPFPSPAPLATVVVARSAPVIDANSVKIINVTGTSFQVTFNGSTNTRDLTRADVTFTAASGTQLTGSQTFQTDLTAGGNTWFSSTDGQNGGGTFSVVIPFSFSGSAQAIPTAVSVTVTNSAGTSAAVSGGR